jgi:predicted ATPase
LPPQLARMAGRDDVVRKLAAQVLEDRFVTILGAAGIGKTTVAIALGHALLDDFGDAVRFIELGSLTDAALVAATVAASLGVPTQADDVLDSLRAFLQDKRLLLVLDNCEHVVEAAAALAEHLFLRAPGVHLLATSREALRVEGEHTHRLRPLETPTDFVGMSVEVPELLLLKGVLQASRSPMDARAVDEALLSAIELAQRQGALALELRASTALARERLRRGGTADVLGELSALYARFTEGMETADLQAARSLLKQRIEPGRRAAEAVKRRQAP